jgi:hydrogenase maturation protease
MVVGRMQAENDAPGLVRYLDGGTLSFTLAGPIAECRCLIVVDAAAMGDPPGTVRVFEGDAMDRQLRQHAKSVHEVSLADLLDIARLTDSLPPRRALVGVEPGLVDWGSELTPAVRAAIPEAMAQVRGLLAVWATGPGVPA